jgi:hypothetical protein
MIVYCAMAVSTLSAASSNKFRLIPVQNYYHTKIRPKSWKRSPKNAFCGLEVKFARKAAVTNSFGNGCSEHAVQVPNARENLAPFARGKALSSPACECSCCLAFALAALRQGFVQACEAAARRIAACRQL